MFSKRRRAASNPPQRAPPSASASLAATKAFVQHRESHTDLSSAAAAAALRSHTSSPTPVGETVTKRMARRGSVSSNGSSMRPSSATALRRQSSSGSMTERSFRAASPARGTPQAFDPPPVPPVPQSLLQGNPHGQHRRASSLEPNYRGASPSPRSGGGGRGVSLDRGASTTPVRGHQRQTSQLEHVAEEEDAGRNSINFSRPMSPAASATKKPSPPTSHGWFGGPVVDHSAVQRAVGRPNSASMRAKPAATSRSFLPPAARQPTGPVDPNSPDAVYDPSTRTFIRKQDAMAIHRELHQEPEQPTRQFVAQHVGDFQRPPMSPPQSGRGSPSPRATRVESPPPQRRAEASRPVTAVRRNEPAAPPRTPEPRAAAADIDTDAKLQSPDSQHTSQHENTDTPEGKTNQDSSYPHLSPAVKPAPPTAAAVQKRASIAAAPDRPVSLSPHRNAHFAPAVVELAGAKHEPLARSVSPAKSALKSSPSVSRRSYSPVTSNGRLASKSASSEASDAASDAGSQKKKKTVRVSFDETPLILSRPASRTEGESRPTQPGLGASKWSPTAEKDNEFEDFMKPRAALPVFGSIREKERRPSSDDVAEKVTETVTTPMSASTGSIMEHSEASNDHALGRLVAQGLAQKTNAPHAPVPPQVTTVEGSGYASDSSEGSGAQKHGGLAESWQLSSVPEPKSLTLKPDEKPLPAASISRQVIEVPQFALQPATPSPHERPEPKFQAMTSPKGWDEAGNQVRPQAGGQAEDAAKDHASNPVTESSTSPKGQQIVFAEDEETTDDNSSVYSDAYEDITDTEAGFGSIDALVRSPAKPSSSGLMTSKYATNATESEAATHEEDGLNSDADSDVTTTQGWGAAQKHWSGVSAAQKQSQQDQPLRKEYSHADPKEPTTGRDTETEVVQRNTHTPAAQVTPNTKPLKSALKKTSAPQAPLAPEPKMRQSMRGPPPREAVPETHMKKSMRAGGMNTSSRAEPTMRTSMRGSSDNGSRASSQIRQSMRGAGSAPPTPVGLAASRHSMPSVETKPLRGALQKKHIHATPAPASKARPQSMSASRQVTAAKPTYDSDSDASASSFQRTRAQGRNRGGQMTMRGSMRQEPALTMRAAAPAPKQVRAISPPGSPSPAIRRSMRPSSPTPEAVKSSKFSIRSLSPMGRFRASKGSDGIPSSPTHAKPMPTFNKQPKPQKPQKQKAPVAKRAKAFTSRFADSSDEDDEAPPRHFQSRFADSDDDEPIDYQLPAGYTPVRGIPRTQEDDDDSTDLEEEQADETPRVASGQTAKAAPSAGSLVNGEINGPSHGQGTALASGSLRDSKWASPAPSSNAGTPTKQKRGFFGMGKKKNSSLGQAKTSEPGLTSGEIPLPPAQRNRDLGLVLTPIDEDRDFDTLVASSPQSKRSPKLQRRSTPEWPLAPPPLIGEEVRPVSSDGVTQRRPHFAKRQSSQISNATAPVNAVPSQSVSYGKTGKKKKFQGLRRVLGIND